MFRTVARRAAGGLLNANETCGRQVTVVLSQYRVVQQLCATVRLQPGTSVVRHLSATATGLVTQRNSTVPMTECRVAGDKTRRAHAVEDIIGYF
jgi:hypothetical protein